MDFEESFGGFSLAGGGWGRETEILESWEAEKLKSCRTETKGLRGAGCWRLTRETGNKLMKAHVQK